MRQHAQQAANRLLKQAFSELLHLLNPEEPYPEIGNAQLNSQGWVEVDADNLGEQQDFSARGYGSLRKKANNIKSF